MDNVLYRILDQYYYIEKIVRDIFNLDSILIIFINHLHHLLSNLEAQQAHPYSHQTQA